jgi:hypothetical protein
MSVMALAWCRALQQANQSVRVNVRRWLKDNSTCPMCRAPVTGEDQQRAPPDHRSRASPWDPRNVETELLFRLGSLQRCAGCLSALHHVFSNRGVPRMQHLLHQHHANLC